MNGETIIQWGGNALRLAWCYTRRPKFGQKELQGFIASSYKKQQIWARVSITLDCALGIEDVA